MLAKNFKHAFFGLWQALSQEKIFRFQWLMAFLVMLVLQIFALDLIWQAVLLLCCAGVLSLELVNCSLEKLCDASGQSYCPHKKAVKDLAAAAVLVFSSFTLLVIALLAKTLLAQSQVNIALLLIFILLAHAPACLKKVTFNRIIFFALLAMALSCHVFLLIKFCQNYFFAVLAIIFHILLFVSHFYYQKKSIKSTQYG